MILDEAQELYKDYIGCYLYNTSGYCVGLIVDIVQFDGLICFQTHGGKHGKFWQVDRLNSGKIDGVTIKCK